MMKPSRDQTELLVSSALLEDAPWGDITSQSLIPASAVVMAHLVAREAGTLCGADLAVAAFTLTDAVIEARFFLSDGQAFAPGTTLATFRGSARSILQAERVALNFVQRLSGIATLTAAYVHAAAGTSARITDTRKTTPGLRLFERYAVRCGGGHNHRFSLSDAFMAKDNHLAVLAALHPGETAAAILAAAVHSARAALPHTTHIEIEVDRPDQIDAALEAGADTILLDNFGTPDLRSAVQHIAGRALTEASGGVTLDRIPEIAATGVDLISVGALTHSVRSLDLGLDILPDPLRG